jgi:hypothetical protein
MLLSPLTSAAFLGHSSVKWSLLWQYAHVTRALRDPAAV